MTTFNDYAYTKGDAANFKTPRFLRWSWYRPNKIDATVRNRSDLQVKEAYRSAGIIRGKHPYALIVDDYQAADGKKHNYDWIANIARDLTIWKTETYVSVRGRHVKPRAAPKGARLIHDVYLIPSEDLINPDNYERFRPPHGTPTLLMRFVQMAGSSQGLKDAAMGGNASIIVDSSGDRRLVMKTRAVNPEFKVILYAYRLNKDPQLKTNWGQGLKTLTVSFSKGRSKDAASDRIQFVSRAGQRTSFTIGHDNGNGQAVSYAFGVNEK